MIPKERLAEIIEQHNNKLITVKQIISNYHISRSWFFELKKRLRKGENLSKPRGHRRQKLTKNQKTFIRQTFAELIEYEKNRIKFPKMSLLKKVVESEIPDIPKVCREIYRQTVRDMDIYPKNIGRTNKKFYFESPAVGHLVQRDVSCGKWIKGCASVYLMTCMDYHTKYVIYGKIFEMDNVKARFDSLEEIFRNFGLPNIFYYSENRNNHRCLNEEQMLNVKESLNEIGIEVIDKDSYNPYNRGIIKNHLAELQKKLFFFLNQIKIDDLFEANTALQKFIDNYNTTYNDELGTTPEIRFKTAEDVFRPLKEKEMDLIDNALSLSCKARVIKSNIVEYKGTLFYIPASENLNLEGSEVLIREKPKKWIRVFHNNKILAQFNYKETRQEAF